MKKTFIEVEKLFRNRKYSKALEIYQATANQHSDTAEYHEKIAECLLELGRLTDAKLECEAAISINKKSSEAYYLLGLISEKEGNLENAEKFLNTSLLLKPESAETLNALGITLFKKNLLKESLQAFSKATSLNPNFWKSHSNSAIVLRAQNKFTESLTESIKAMRIAPSPQTAYWSIVAFELAHPNYLGVINLVLWILLLVFRHIYLLPIAILFFFAISLRTSIWFVFGLKIRGAATILFGVATMAWYIYGITR